MTAKRLTAEELEAIAERAAMTEPWPSIRKDRRDLLGHIEALEAELLATEADPPRGSRCWRCELELGKARTECDRLRAEVERLRGALGQIAALDCDVDHNSRGEPCPERMARAALEAKP